MSWLLPAAGRWCGAVFVLLGLAGPATAIAGQAPASGEVAVVCPAQQDRPAEGEGQEDATPQEDPAQDEDVAQDKEQERAEQKAVKQAEKEAQQAVKDAEKKALEEERARVSEALAAGEDVPIEDIPEEDVDDTPEVDTESSVDTATEKRGLSFFGDLRPIITDTEEEGRDGSTVADGAIGGRFRIEGTLGITRKVRFITRVAGLCFENDCDGDFVFSTASPETTGLEDGQTTLDEMFLHWFRRERFDIAVGRLQTRFVLRGGVYAKSLDRNDSNNVNVTWTDGLHATYRAQNGWTSHIIVQHNIDAGTGSIRRAPLDFADHSAHRTYFVAVENARGWGPIVQRAFDVSYLPDSLLKDGDAAGRREDYWGLVGRMAVRWPQKAQGPRLRAGIEAGYAPETPTEAAVSIDGTGDTDGVAWDVVASIMDFRPGHSIGINYGRAGAGWLLSPQFRPNDELLEIRWLWRHERFPLVEARIRQRDEIDQLTGATRKRDEFDFYLRLTWQFTLREP